VQLQDELEEEQAELERQACQLRSSLEASESALPELHEEIAQAGTWARLEEERADEAEREKHELLEELAALPRSGRGGVSGQDEGRAEIDVAGKRALEEAHSETETLTGEIASLRGEENQYRGESQTAALEHAEEAAAVLRREVTDAGTALAAAEEESRRLAEEHRTLEDEGGPVQEWLDHVDHELEVARAENVELTAKVAAESKERAELQQDELDAMPLRQAGMDVRQVLFLQEHERESLAQKAALIEEISEHRARRAAYLAEARRYQQEAASSDSHKEECRVRPPAVNRIVLPGSSRSRGVPTQRTTSTPAPPVPSVESSSTNAAESLKLPALAPEPSLGNLGVGTLRSSAGGPDASCVAPARHGGAPTQALMRPPGSPASFPHSPVGSPRMPDVGDGGSTRDLHSGVDRQSPLPIEHVSPWVSSATALEFLLPPSNDSAHGQQLEPSNIPLSPDSEELDESGYPLSFSYWDGMHHDEW